MRQVRLTPEAERTLGSQIDYLIAQGSVRAAATMADRVEAFLCNTLASSPRAGRHLARRDLWETWIPRTRLVTWYTFTDDELTVLTFWHTAQDRDGG